MCPIRLRRTCKIPSDERAPYITLPKGSIFIVLETWGQIYQEYCPYQLDMVDNFYIRLKIWIPMKYAFKRIHSWRTNRREKVKTPMEYAWTTGNYCDKVSVSEQDLQKIHKRIFRTLLMCLNRYNIGRWIMPSLPIGYKKWLYDLIEDRFTLLKHYLVLKELK